MLGKVIGRSLAASLVVLLLATASLVHLGFVDDRSGQVAPADGDGPAPCVPQAPDVTAAMGALAPGFLENRGQVADPGVVLYAQGGPLSVGFARGAVRFVLASGAGGPLADRSGREVCAFSLAFEGARDVVPRGEGPLGHPTHFIRGAQAGGSVTARSFSEVVYGGLYDGVDLRFRFDGGRLKYDLVLAAGADPSSVSLRYDGVGSVAIDGVTGQLVVSTPLGQMRDERPTVSQTGLGTVPCSFAMRGDRAYGFDLPGGLLADLPMVIDPGIEFLTYLGGLNYDGAWSVDVDTDGNIVVAGVTYSANFPTTPGSYRSDITLIQTPDAFVVKLDPTGSSLVWSTFFGGAGEDQGEGVRVASDGTVFLAGSTSSGGIVAPAGAMNATYLGGASDGFVARLSADGARLLNFTFLGGIGAEGAWSMCLGPSGDVFVTGVTTSSDLYVSPGAYCATCVPGVDQAVFAMRISGDLGSLVYGTYLDGEAWDQPRALRVDGSGVAYVAGATNSSHFPTTTDAFDRSFDDANDALDGFLLALSADGRSLVGSTYLGGEWEDESYGLLLLSNGSVLVTGTTESDGLATPGALYPDTLGVPDAFLAMFDDRLTQMQYFTYLGGEFTDRGASLAMGTDGHTVYLAGTTYSHDLPFTQGGADDSVIIAGEGFLLGFDLSAGNITYLTTIAGSDWDLVQWDDTVVADGGGSLIVVGMTQSDDLLATPGAFSTNWAGYVDTFVVKIDPRPCGLPEAPRDLEASVGDGWVDLKWSPARWEGCRNLGYRVYRGPTAKFNDSTWYSPVLAATELNDTGVITGTQYHYHVVTVSIWGEGAASSVGVKPMGLPGRPTGLVGTSGDRNVTLRWDPPAYTGGTAIPIKGYRVLRGGTIAGLRVVANVSAAEYVDSTATTGVPTYYVVLAYNERGDGPRSDHILVTPYGPPSAPTGVLADAQDMYVKLTWGVPADDGGAALSHYIVERGSEGSAKREVKNLSARDKREFTDDLLQNGIEYWYNITPFNVYGGGVPARARATPFGAPFAPTGLTIKKDGSQVILRWAPSDGNGRSVTAYEILRIEYGPTTVTTNHFITVESLVFTDILPGVLYELKVRARNLAGDGPWSEAVEFIDLPAAVQPTGLAHTCTLRGVNLTWQYTGTVSRLGLVYTVFRGGSPGSLDPIDVVENATWYMDTTAQPGRTYYYAVSANNTREAGPMSEPHSAFVATVPGPVGNLTAVATDARVVLVWSTPLDDGGATIREYVVMRGTTAGALAELARTPHISYTDTNVTNGQQYYYRVLARNDVGFVEEGLPKAAMPLAPPGPPTNFKVKYEGGIVRLTWSAPSVGGRAAVVGYIVYKGTSPDAMTRVAMLGNVLTLNDGAVVRGQTYHYSVAALSASGTGDNSTVVPLKVTAKVAEGMAGWVLPLVVVLAVVLALAIYGAVALRRGREEAAAGEALATTPGTPAGGAPAAAARKGQPNIVEELLVVFRDGRLIADCSREGCKTRDADLVSGMLIAVQGIIQDGLEHGGTLRSINYGDNVIKIVSGHHVNIAAVVYGIPDSRLEEELEAAIQRIEASYAGVIEDWVGDMSTLTEVDRMVRPIIERTATLTRDQVGGVEERKMVSMLSAVDFYKGYVRLNVAVSNGMDEAIMDVAVEVHYDTDMLRLERAKPETLYLRGDRASLGNVKPSERKTVSFLFDPQICQSTQVDGTLIYYDTKGAVHRLEMKRRHAEVVCPIFFTKKQANTAMLRRLIAERLHSSDLRTFRFPEGMQPRDVLGMAKHALGGMDVRLVREYIVEGPPFEAEVWFYAETKVKQLQVVIRLGILERERALELFVASSAMEPVTGLLAELRREVDMAVKERRPEGPGLTLERDEALQRGIASRPMLIDTLPD